MISGSPQRNLHVVAKIDDENQQEKAFVFRGYVDSSSEPSGHGGLVVKKGDYLRIESKCSITSTKFQIVGSLLAGKMVPGGWSGTDESSLTPPGYLYGLEGTDPAAGSAGTETVPTGARWRLRGIQQALVTSGTSANRRVRIVQDNASFGAFSKQEAGLTQAASLTYTYMGGAGSSTDAAVNASNQVSIQLPEDIWLAAGERIRTLVGAIGVGDNLGAPGLLIEELLD